jgi:hypothetical protein
MTKKRLMKSNWEEFAHGLGYHLAHKPMMKDKMINLYLAERVVRGSAYELLPTYEIMLRVFRNTVNPKKENHDEVHGFLVNLLVLTQQNKGIGKQLDSMDYKWHEMRDYAFLCKLPAFAPYIMRLICIKWNQAGRGDLLTQCGRLTTHLVHSPTAKTHSKPRFGPGAPDDEEEQAAANSVDSDYMPPSSKTKDWFAKITAHLKKSFCFKEDLQDWMYYEHVETKKTRQCQKAMMVHMNLPVSDGPENIITPPEEWNSKHKRTSSKDSIPERTQSQGHDEEEDEDEDGGDEYEDYDDDEDEENEDKDDEDDE